MEFRSRSCRDEGCHAGGRGFPGNMQDLRSYSANYSSQKEGKMKKGKKASKSWSFSDPEVQRKKRVASYRVYDMEGKMKGSLRKSFRWVKNSYNHVIYGWW
ncbi:uncharacterized protein LOC114762149 [Neltuma alba]|uniref:uncharacterized protein LOC114750613 n=1 Tax=Neltuma alba TaxID=207710 RepID=UPI0010A40C1C|nr:uncharacterized protein LOC114750613 [Prosopis alba]XP_028795694.1 uncharacterized protein LOC114751193 [Prosopis alba]XP_028807441.1 uncharacterized protein LOC114762149 [Prosopis alba]